MTKTNEMTRRTFLQTGLNIPPGLAGRIMLMRRNYGGASTEVEWFECSTIESAGGWEVPATVNGFYYVLEQ